MQRAAQPLITRTEIPAVIVAYDVASRRATGSAGGRGDLDRSNFDRPSTAVCRSCPAGPNISPRPRSPPAGHVAVGAGYAKLDSGGEGQSGQTDRDCLSSRLPFRQNRSGRHAKREQRQARAHLLSLSAARVQDPPVTRAYAGRSRHGGVSLWRSVSWPRLVLPARRDL